MIRSGNLFANIPFDLPEERFEPLVATPHVRIERIVSPGQASPADFWYDQPWAEWVVVLAGEARVEFEGEPSVQHLRRGDYLHIPAHAKHRVAWTDPAQPTVWLAVHHA